jgi:hypothetical protein
MSSLSIINKALPRASGTGLPFYLDPNQIFSWENVEFNSSNGLWMVPLDRLPTFQLHIPQNNPKPLDVEKIEYLETRGDGDFTGYVFNIPNPAVTMVKAAKKDGDQIYIFQSDDNYKLIEKPRCGRWIIRLQVKEQPTGLIYIVYSEEFLTIDM